MDDKWLDQWMAGASKREALMQVLAAFRNAMMSNEEALRWSKAYEKKFGVLTAANAAGNFD